MVLAGWRGASARSRPEGECHSSLIRGEMHGSKALFARESLVFDDFPGGRPAWRSYRSVVATDAALMIGELTVWMMPSTFWMSV